MKYPENNGATGRVEENQGSYESGFRLVYRSTITHDLIGFKKPFTKAEAWIWLLLHAVGEEAGITTKIYGKEMFVGYGSYIFSARNLAKEWGWGRQPIRTYLKKLQEDNMITTRVVELTQGATQRLTHLTICNFEFYQRRKPREQPKEQPTLRSVSYTSYNADNSKKPPIPENANGSEAVKWFCEIYEYYFEIPYQPNWKIDGAQMKRLVKTYGQELFGIIDHYLNTESNERHFWTTIPRTPAKLSSFINDVVQHRKEFSV